MPPAGRRLAARDTRPLRAPPSAGCGTGNARHLRRAGSCVVIRWPRAKDSEDRPPAPRPRVQWPAGRASAVTASQRSGIRPAPESEDLTSVPSGLGTRSGTDGSCRRSNLSQLARTHTAEGNEEGVTLHVGRVAGSLDALTGEPSVGAATHRAGCSREQPTPVRVGDEPSPRRPVGDPRP